MHNHVSRKISFRPYMYPKQNKKGLCKVAILVIINRQNCYIPLDVEINPYYWIKDKGEVDRRYENSQDINMIIKRAMGRINDIVIKYKLSQMPLDSELLKKIYCTNYDSDDFLAFFKDHMWNHVRLTQSRTAYTNYQACLDKLKRCFGMVTFHDLGYDFILKFDRFMKQVDKNSPNTVSKYHGKVKAMVNVAIKKGYEIKNPYDNFKLQKFKTRPNFLTIDEIRKLVELYKSEELESKVQESLRAFLFSCFTSLRLSDVRAFRIDQIKDDEIQLMPKKTRHLEKVVNIPLTGQAKKYIDFEKFDDQFDMLSDQKVNQHLKKIGQHVGLRKNLTFHVARHTFATTFLEIGGKVEVLRELLNHSSIVDTMVYVHITSKHKEKQMENFDREF